MTTNTVIYIYICIYIYLYIYILAGFIKDIKVCWCNFFSVFCWRILLGIGTEQLSKIDFTFYRALLEGIRQWPRIPGFNSRSSYPKDSKNGTWYHLGLTLSIIRYVSRVKWSNPRRGVATTSTPQCRSYWKGSLRVALDYRRQLSFSLSLSLSLSLTHTRIYIYIYIVIIYF